MTIKMTAPTEKGNEFKQAMTRRRRKTSLTATLPQAIICFNGLYMNPRYAPTKRKPYCAMKSKMWE